MGDQKMYYLDLQTLLTYLNGQSCELTTELKVAGKIARGFLVLRQGKIAHCSLVFQNGHQIVGEEAYKQIKGCTQWQVKLERPEEKRNGTPPVQFSPVSESFPTASSGSTGSLRSTPILRQKRAFDPALVQNLSWKERLILRSVFSMVDGRRTIDEMKAQLHMSPDNVDQALNHLYLLDLIE